MADAIFYTDHKNLFLKYPLGLQGCKNNINFDLYKEIFDLVRIKDISLEVKWIPAHTWEDELPPGMSLQDHWGNRYADKFAKLAASS